MFVKDLFDLSNSHRARFTCGYTVPIYRAMHLNSAGGGEVLDWNAYSLGEASSVDDLRRYCHYDEAIACLSNLVFAGSRVLVVGSSVPWLECLLARGGAEEIMTVEYRPIRWEPRFTRTRWSACEFSEFCKRSASRDFDVLVSYSSIEHSGLGRYGDDIDPDGDLVTLAVAQRWLVPTARVLLALPVGADAILFNRHRVYGKNRLSVLARLLAKPKIRVVPPSPEYSSQFVPDQWSLEYAFNARPQDARPVYDRQLLLEFS